MAMPAVLSAFNTRIAGWSNINACPRMGINQLAASPVRYWLEVEATVSAEDREEMGPPPALYREHGVMRLTVRAPALDGIDQALTYCEELRDLFRDTEFSGVTTYPVDAPTFDEKNRRGVYYGAAILVPYHYDYTKG